MRRMTVLMMLPVAATLGFAVPAAAQMGPGGVSASNGLPNGGQRMQWRQGGYGQGGYGHGGWGGQGWGGGWRGAGWGGPGYGYGYGGWGSGAGVAAGLATGAIVGGALAASQQPYYSGRSVYASPDGDADSVAYCQQRFRSYDINSGTYLGNDGYRHACP